MGLRMYHVKFEGRESDEQEWDQNWSERTVGVHGGAAAAIDVATSREQRVYPGFELRVTDVQFLCEEED